MCIVRAVLFSARTATNEAWPYAAKKPFSQDEVIAQYKRLISSMPRANQYLLLYVLDLLTVFARRAERNRMNASSEWALSLSLFGVD
jgi:hypothetical protein